MRWWHYCENKATLLAQRNYAIIANAIVSVGFTPNGTHFVSGKVLAAGIPSA